MAKGNGNASVDLDHMERAVGDPTIRQALLEVGDGDPAPAASVLPRERAEQIVRNISLTTLDQLRELRDKIDNLMRSVTAEQDAIIGRLCDHATFAEDAIKAKLIIADTVDALAKQFGDHNIPPTVSVERRQ